MIEKDIKVKDVEIHTIESDSSHNVEHSFLKWKSENPECKILDVSYRSAASPSREGRLFRIYTLTLVFTRK